MATRHNACVNAALDNDDAGWGGEAAPARTSLTGFIRPFGARYTAGTFMRTAAGAAVPGVGYTLSVDTRPVNQFVPGGNIYIEWRDSLGGVITYTTGTYTVTANVVTRASMTGTAPAGTVTAQLVLDGVNYAVTTLDSTAMLIEPTTVLDNYFDGNTTPGGSWDGTPGSSPSTFTDTVQGSLAAALPALIGGLDGSAKVSAAVAASLPTLTSSLAGALTVAGAATSVLPGLTGSASGVVRAAGTLTAGLPALTAAVQGVVTAPAGSLAAVLPSLTASLTGTSDAVDLPEPAVRVGPPRLGWPVGTPSLSWPVRPPKLGR